MRVRTRGLRPRRLRPRRLRPRARAATRPRRGTAGARINGRSVIVGRPGGVLLTRMAGSPGRSPAHCVKLIAQTGDLGTQAIALTKQIRQLPAYRLRLGPSRGSGLPTDLRCFLLRRLQDVLHTVGEGADHVLLIGPRTGGRPRAWGRRRRQAGPETWRRRYDRQRLTAGGFQIGAHPRQHPLQAADVLVDLSPVVSAQHDIEAWGTWPPHVCRHRDALPLVPSPRRGLGDPVRGTGSFTPTEHTESRSIDCSRCFAAGQAAAQPVKDLRAYHRQSGHLVAAHAA